MEQNQDKNSCFVSKGHLFLFNHFIDMRTTVSLSISYRKNVVLLKFSNKNTFFPHEMDKLMVALMSIKWLNKERRPLVYTVRTPLPNIYFCLPAVKLFWQDYIDKSTLKIWYNSYFLRKLECNITSTQLQLLILFLWVGII